ncbi:MAG TPA: 3-(methylthio)propionyl-CoA ligase [Noviherbaspirillum sp.]
MSDHERVPVFGQMMNQPLLISSLLVHADRYFGDREIVSRGEDGTTHRYTYRECHQRARRMANALGALGIGMGERVATLAWNGYRHLELYYAISGMGSVMHTINPRLHRDQLAYIVNDAEDELVFFEKSFLKLVADIAPDCPGVKAFVLLGAASDMPQEHGIPKLLCYEDLMAAHAPDYAWPSFDERAASSLCYTSGTTGNPKGVLYSHRSTLLHAYASVAPDVLNLSARDCIMPIVPMFHVNAWGLPYAAALVGAKLVLPGPALDGQSLYALCESEGVSFSAGVPTVWLGLLNHVETNALRFTTFRRAVVGGSACPPAMMETFKTRFGVDVQHAFGMTELSPIGTSSTLQAHHLALSEEGQRDVLLSQGHALFGIDMRIADDDGKDIAWDGKTAGHLMMRGPWVIDSYFRQPRGSALCDGWFATGDVATISTDGYLRITDRSKDVIKSGGEWIGSIDIENIALSHPSIQQAACIGVPHPWWGERPLLVAVVKPGMALAKEELLEFYRGRIAKWWTPDDVAFVDGLPIGATGKVQKNRLREQFAKHQMTTTQVQPASANHDK